MSGGFNCCLNKPEELRKTEHDNCALFSPHAEEKLSIRTVFKGAHKGAGEMVQGTPDMYMHLHTCRQITHTYKIKTNKLKIK